MQATLHFIATMNQETGIKRALALFDNSPSKLARAMGEDVLRQHVEHWLKGGRVPPERAPALEKLCGMKVRLWDLRPGDWHLIWPELVGTEGAPQPETAAPASQPSATA